MLEHQFSSGSMATAKRAPDSFATCAKCGTSSNCDEVWNFYGKIKSIMADTVYCPDNNHLPAPSFLLMYSQFSSQRSTDSREGVSLPQPRDLVMLGLGLSIEPCFTHRWEGSSLGTLFPIKTYCQISYLFSIIILASQQHLKVLLLPSFSYGLLLFRSYPGLFFLFMTIGLNH